MRPNLNKKIIRSVLTQLHGEARHRNRNKNCNQKNRNSGIQESDELVQKSKNFKEQENASDENGSEEESEKYEVVEDGSEEEHDDQEANEESF